MLLSGHKMAVLYACIDKTRSVVRCEVSVIKMLIIIMLIADLGGHSYFLFHTISSESI